MIIHAPAERSAHDSYCGDGFAVPQESWQQVTCRDCLRLGADRGEWLSIEPRRRLEELDRQERVS